MRHKNMIKHSGVSMLALSLACGVSAGAGAQQDTGMDLEEIVVTCLLYTSDAADDLLCVDLGGRRIIKKKKKHNINYNYIITILTSLHFHIYRFSVESALM
eukprot:TRINITY_DN286_c0_g1_i12.p1 TRINITY_DN286_c0_g1~~TRINITY_DN286_c0_g1_i12.p1  ORF type:complete len:101 (+),score=32.27 TRINITY_DN286_c0_g1_i12:253-555(+)